MLRCFAVRIFVSERCIVEDNQSAWKPVRFFSAIVNMRVPGGHRSPYLTGKA